MTKYFNRKNAVKESKKSVHVTYRFVEFLPSTLEESVIYIVKDNFAAHKCLCGCQNKTVMPLCKMGWMLSEHNNKISLSPSIGNYQFPCNSHYAITNSIANFIQ